MDECFRTIVPIKPFRFALDHASTILTMGSCFAEKIGARLQDNCFKSLCNPTGILFNPYSIATALTRILKKEEYTTGDLFFHEGQWKSFDHHSDFNRSDPDETLAAINQPFRNAVSFFDTCDTIMITFGTAAVYVHKELNHTVANCHKLPHDTFNRRMLTIQEIVETYTNLFSLLQKKNPSLAIILTVSPVRHLRDDPHENCVSKSRLIAATDELLQRFSKVTYFPSYEIMMDELRDYRFYEADMAHPNITAIDYIWQRFCETCITERSRAFMREFAPVRLAMNHRLQKKEQRAVSEFKRTMIEKTESLKHRYPEITLDAVMEHFQQISV